MNGSTPITVFCQRLESEIERQLQFLFQTKHLYQKATLDLGPISAQLQGGPEIAQRFAKRRILIELERRVQQRQNLADPFVTISPKNVKIFCGSCGDAEAFKATWAQECSTPFPDLDAPNQLFAFSYECQRCFSFIQGFMVRRKGWDFYLEGRSPIEQVLVEPYIPKKEARFLKDAILARNSGKLLAAFLYLRVFIEQFGRRLTGITGREDGDTILEKSRS